MILSLCVLGALASSALSLATLTARNSTTPTSWMGTNLYYLQGLSAADQDAYIAAMAADGVKVVRVWVNGQTAGACQKGSLIAADVPALETAALGEYNNATLDALDGVLVKLEDKGIKALISPHDANSLLGDYRADIYYDQFGSAGFYEDEEAFTAYDARLSYILNYCGASSGKIWKEWSEAIMGFDLQNEPMTANTTACTNNDERGWLCGRATHLRSELGADNPIIVSSGGIGGDYSHDCTFISAATECAALDAIAVHRYASVPGYWASNAETWLGQANGKLIYVEEWGINAASYDQSSAFPSEVEDMNSVGLPSLYWELILPASTACPYNAADDSGDQFGIVYNSGVNLSGPISEATKSAALQDWSAIIA
ncbi:glycoside hydrolase superfamily [Pestalotiopsis sp. NC0098]|nr:glycoside hydrolase superfamily [Pestalotiopsis sp. NC0098]